jgi:hypothetical protein
VSKKLIKKILDVRYHRNGVTGNGFDVVRFVVGGRAKETERVFLGIVFEERGNVAVVCLDDPGLAPGRNMYRGDLFEGELRKAIEEASDGSRHDQRPVLGA